MKPFDLQAVKRGDPVCTRDGKPVTILRFDLKSYTPIVAVIHYSEDDESAWTFSANGDFVEDTHHLDLFMAGDECAKVEWEE